MKDQQFIFLPRSIRRGRKRPFLIVFDSFDSDRITAVFHCIVNEREHLIGGYTELSSHSLNLYGREDFQPEWNSSLASTAISVPSTIPKNPSTRK